MNSDPASRTSDWVSFALAQFEPRLLNYAQRIVGDEEEARDVVQETFLKLCKQDRSELNGRLAQWLYTVCRNGALDVRRRKSLKGATITGETADATVSLSKEPPPCERATRHDSLAIIRRELEKLTSNQQECIRLKFQHELSYKEISGVTGLSVANVGFLIHTGLKAVRERVDRPSLVAKIQPPTPDRALS